MYNRLAITTQDNPIDVVFLGQSVVEAFDGKHNGEDLTESNEYFGHIKHMFQKRFNSPSVDNHQLVGLPMGISGDQSNNILWRLMHGELNQNFDPPFWWIVIGMEDLARYKCSEEIVIMGVLRIVEEIKKFKPNAKIIVNGLFPMNTLRTTEPQNIDFVDAERDDNATQQKTKKAYKEAMTKKMNEKFQYIKEQNKSRQQELLQSMKKIRTDEQLSKSEKNEKITQVHNDLQRLRNRNQIIQKQITMMKKDEYNPVMKEKHFFHKDNIFHHHGPKEIPVWTAVHAINNQLHEFCQRTEHVTFYDPTPLFANTNGQTTTLLTDYISSRGHPTREGYKLWLNDIQRKVIEWKIKIEEEEEKEKQTKWEIFGSNDDKYYYDDEWNIKVEDDDGKDNDDENQDQDGESNDQDSESGDEDDETSSSDPYYQFDGDDWSENDNENDNEGYFGDDWM